MRICSLAAALGCAAMVFATAGHAQDSAKGKDATLEEARQHAAKAKVHYDLGEFEKAAEEYIIVYRLRPLPALLFNIAQSYRQAGQYEKAKQFYRAYLRENPDAQTSSSVKKALKEIDELLAKEKKTREAPPSGIREAPGEISSRGAAVPPPLVPAPAGTPAAPSASAAATGAVPAVMQPKPASAPPSALPATAAVSTRAEPSSSRRTWTYALAGGSLAMLAAGSVFAIKAKNINNELLSGPHSTATADDLLSQSKSARTVSGVLLIAGVAAGAGAGVLYFMPTSSGAAVGGSF